MPEIDLTTFWSEPPPAVFTFKMTKMVSALASLALGGGRSGCSR